MVHLGHLIGANGLRVQDFALPINFSIRFSEKGWRVDYFEDDTEPEVGDFLAAPENSAMRQLSDDQIVFSYANVQGEIVELTLDEGVKAIPFWLSKSSAQSFESYVGDLDVLISDTLASLRQRASESGTSFLAPEFLTADFDIAILV